MKQEKLESFLVGYNVENAVVTSILILLLCLFSYLIFFRFKHHRLWKIGLVKLYLGVILAFLAISFIFLLFSSIHVHKHRENLKGRYEGINYIEGIPSLQRIPFSSKDTTGAQMSIAKLKGVIFPVGRYPSDCINGRLVYRFNKASKYYSEKVVFRAWYTKKTASGYLKKLQGFSACLLKLEIVERVDSQEES